MGDSKVCYVNGEVDINEWQQEAVKVLAEKKPSEMTARERVLVEYNELKERYHKLDDFFWTVAFNKIPARQQELMYLQETFMSGYLEILEQRLRYWEDKE